MGKNGHKVEPISGPIKNLSKSLMISKSSKTNLKFPFLISKNSPIVSFLQDCRAIRSCYWTKIPKVWLFVPKKDLNFAITKNKLTIPVPNFQNLHCRAISSCCQTKIVKKITCIKKEKEAKNPQSVALFQKKDLHFVISKFSFFF